MAIRVQLVLVLALLLGGCASRGGRGSAALMIAPGDYARAFDAARDVLAASRFSLERVDARAGVITTRPKATVGLATPWDAEQATIEQEFDDLINQHERRVRIAFEPARLPAAPDAEASDGGGRPSAPRADLTTFSGPIVARVEAWVERTARPGWRVDTTAVRLSQAWRDPALQERGVAGRYTVPTTRDDALAAAIGERIATRLREAKK
ncbi:MAG: hypothetical protein JNM80_12300 [Phycisphaerae bacterium]|nr:hypothetical protein [Phycisphaerae bacterium]